MLVIEPYEGKFYVKRNVKLVRPFHPTRSEARVGTAATQTHFASRGKYYAKQPVLATHYTHPRPPFTSRGKYHAKQYSDTHSSLVSKLKQAIEITNSALLNSPPVCDSYLVKIKDLLTEAYRLAIKR